MKHVSIRVRGRLTMAAMGLLLGVLASGGSAQTPAKPAQPRPSSPHARSGSNDRRAVGITVYNQNFGLVREVRTSSLPKGRVELEFRDVASQIQPETVHIKSLAGGPALRVLEQNYRYDLLSPQKLLEKYVGRRVRIYRWNEKTGKDEVVDAEVLSIAESPVLKIGNEITFNYPGRIAFPEVPANLIAKPTLVWLLENGGAKQDVEVTYLTQGLNWKADYVLVIDGSDSKGDLTGWVTLTNQSGASYEGARLKLVAGDVQRVADPSDMMKAGRAFAAPEAASSRFREEGFFEYHLYTLDRPATLLDNEQKQVTLLEAQGIKLSKRLIFYGAPSYFRGNYGQIVSNQKVGVYLDIENRSQNRLGIPLPKGTVRVYKADASGSKQFVGEDAIDHTPRDERIRIKMGEAFDVVGDRKQVDFKTLGTCAFESSWEIALRNHKSTPVEVEIYEPVGAEWEVLNSNLPATKKDQQTLTFKAGVRARGEIKVRYRIRVRYC